MLDSEVRAVGKLGASVFARPAVLAKGVHTAVASRTFRALGVLGIPARAMHEAIAASAYRLVEMALQAPLAGGSAALAATRRLRGAPLAESPRGRLALGALNGFYGDALARDHRDLALELTVRRDGADLDTDQTALAIAFPDATSRLVVFVHGLCETEDAWSLLPLGGSARSRRGYGSRLRDELGYTPLYVRYNTGLHVSENGRRLAEQLERVVRGWPVEVEAIALIGHSMGGLVARSACHYGDAEGHAWTKAVRHVFCLGTPHLGAPLEKGANALGWALGRLPETQPFAELVNARSAGIKDLRYGSCVEEDWCDCDPDEFLRDRCCEVPFLPTATYYFIGATIARDVDSPFGSLVGDLLVRYPSASGIGRRRRIPFEIENGRHLGGLNHIQLLNHPAVYEQIHGWLEPGRVTGAPL